MVEPEIHVIYHFIENGIRWSICRYSGIDRNRVKNLVTEATEELNVDRTTYSVEQKLDFLEKRLDQLERKIEKNDR